MRKMFLLGAMACALATMAACGKEEIQPVEIDQTTRLALDNLNEPMPTWAWEGLFGMTD